MKCYALEKQQFIDKADDIKLIVMMMMMMMMMMIMIAMVAVVVVVVVEVVVPMMMMTQGPNLWPAGHQCNSKFSVGDQNYKASHQKVTKFQCFVNVLNWHSRN